MPRFGLLSQTYPIIGVSVFLSWNSTGIYANLQLFCCCYDFKSCSSVVVFLNINSINAMRIDIVESLSFSLYFLVICCFVLCIYIFKYKMFVCIIII